MLKPQSTAGRRITPYLVYMVSGLLMTVAACGCNRSGQEAEKRLDQSIRAAVPAITSRPQAEAWLKANGIEFSYWTDTTRDRLGDQTMARRVGLRDEALSGMTRGTIECPNAAAGITQTGRLSIYFFFDKQGACVGHLVHWFEYCL